MTGTPRSENGRETAGNDMDTNSGSNNCSDEPTRTGNDKRDTGLDQSQAVIWTENETQSSQTKHKVRKNCRRTRI